MTTFIELHEHQKKAVEAMHNGCVLVGDVGTGKTITALSYALTKEPGKSIFVITTAKKRDSGDWQHEAALLGVPVDDFFVDSWNNISKYATEENALFIFDEQRLVGTGAWVKSFYKIAKENRWILLSATPGDTWLDYVPVFVANGFYKNITEFRDEHVIYSRFSKYPKVQKYIKEAKLYRFRDQILVDMPMERHTTRHMEMVECTYDQELFDKVWKRRWNVYEEEPIRDAGELFRVARKVVAQDASRIGSILEVLKKHQRLIIFYNFDYELEDLRTLCRSLNQGLDGTIWEIEWAEWNGHKHEKIPDSDSWIYLVQYLSGSEGWNCTTTDAILFYSLTYSYKQFHQAQGRIDRMNTSYEDLYYYVLTTKSIVDKAVWRALKMKKDFNVRAQKW